MNKQAEFLTKLAALMREYDVTIGFSVGEFSDTHGLYEEKMYISHRPDKKSWREDTWFEVDGWSMTASEVEP